MKNSKRNELQNRDLTTRTYMLRADTLNLKDRSIEAVVATEAPVMVLDLNRFEVIEEVLLMSGVRLPANGQVPMLDSHDRSTVRKILGSTQNLRVEDDQLLGRNVFSAQPEAETAFTLVKERHLKDNSIGYVVKKPVIIEKGKEAEVEGRTFRASADRDLRIAIEWEIKENSVTAIGADQEAKNRKESDAMKKNKKSQDPLELERQRIAEIKEMAGEEEKSDIPTELVERCIAEGNTIDETKALFLQAIRGQRPKVTSSGLPNNASITVGNDLGKESLPAALTDAILQRANIDLIKLDFYGNPVTDGDGRVEKREPHPRSQQFLNIRIADIARQLLIVGGTQEAGTFSDQRAIRQAIKLSERQRGTSTGFSTFSLPEILGDTMYRSLLASYVEYPVQWPNFCKKTMHNNFKEFTRAQLGELDNVEAIPEGGEYTYATVGERAEKFRLLKYGKIFGLTFEQMLADNLHAFNEIPGKLGQTARRLEDTLAFAILTENAAMADGIVIFHADHGNLAGAGAAPSVTTLNTAKIAFRKQTGVDGKTFINITPKVMIIPVDIEGDSAMLLASEWDPADENNKKANVWKGKLSLCTHPLLSADSTTAWYLSAASGQGGIEMCFLLSEQTPHLEREAGFENDTLRWKIRHSCASKCIDHRAVYKNPGA